VLYGDAGPDPTLVLFYLGFHDIVIYVFNMTARAVVIVIVS